jgi:hypothetical protein
MERTTMKQVVLIVATLAAGTILSAAPISLYWSTREGVSVSQDKALAIVGRPATPASVAGVARRTTRRAVRRHY